MSYRSIVFMGCLHPMPDYARLLKRVFEIDLEHCPQCGCELKIITAIEEPAVTACRAGDRVADGEKGYLNFLLAFRLMQVNSFLIAAPRIRLGTPLHNLSRANHRLQTLIHDRIPPTRMDIRSPAVAVDCRHRGGVVATAGELPAYQCTSGRFTETILRRMARLARFPRQAAHIRRPGKLAMLVLS